MEKDQPDRPVADHPIERIQPEDAREPVRVLGWVVRREESGDAYFPDATYGSREESYRAARAWVETVGGVDETDLTNISRIERNSDAKGYRVRIRRQYKAYTKYFSDRRLGGRRGALRAAQYWRDVKKGRRPEGREAPIPDELILEDEVDNYSRAAVERSQFGVPRMSVDVRVMESGNPIPYVHATWPIEDGRSRYTYAPFDDRRVEEAAKEVCRALVQARRASDLTPDELGRRATPFDVLDGWFAETDLSVDAEADALFEAVWPRLKQRAKDVLSAWRQKKKGLPGVGIRVKKNDAGRYAPFVRAGWRDPSGDFRERQREIRGDDVEGALQQLASDLVQDYRSHPEPDRLREQGRTPFSVLDASPDRPEKCVNRLVEIGLSDLTRQLKDLKQGVSGLRLSRKEVDSGLSQRGRGRPMKRYTLLLAWPTDTGYRRRQKSFDTRGEVKEALQTVVRRALTEARQSDPEDVRAALQTGSPFEGIDPETLRSSDGLERAIRRVVRTALPSLRLELEALDSERGPDGASPEEVSSE